MSKTPTRRETNLHVWSPESEIVPQQLHDESAVFVGFLTQCIQLSYGFFEGLKEIKNHLKSETEHSLHNKLVSTYPSCEGINLWLSSPL